jgi:hypothetical protein
MTAMTPDPGNTRLPRATRHRAQGHSPAAPGVGPTTPSNAGSPAKEPADIGELVSSYYARRCV